MAFVHGHRREAGWVVSHYRRPQVPGDGQLRLPSPRPPGDADDAPEQGARPEEREEPEPGR